MTEMRPRVLMLRIILVCLGAVAAVVADDGGG